MRKEYYNYVVKLPVLLHELFRGKVADYHFSDMTVVMNHLVKSYIRMTDGGRVSTATRRILLCMDRIPDMSFFFRRQEKAVLFFEMDPAVADSLQRAIVSWHFHSGPFAPAHYNSRFPDPGTACIVSWKTWSEDFLPCVFPFLPVNSL